VLERSLEGSFQNAFINLKKDGMVVSLKSETHVENANIYIEPNTGSCTILYIEPNTGSYPIFN